MSTEGVIADLAREAERRYYGKYRGFVADNDDPQRLGRVRLQVPAVLGDRTTGWALPCVPFGGSADSGMLAVPEQGAEVWVEFEMGDPSHPIWVGSFWTSAPDRSGDQDLGPWQTRTLRTARGQVLRLDDADGSTGVTLRHHTGAVVRIADDGSIHLDDARGQVVTLDAGGSRLLAEDGNGNRIQLTSSGISLDNGQGSKVELGASGVTISGTTVTVDAQVVNLAGGGEPVLKGTSFLAAYMAHIHPSAAGPTSPPVPTTETSALSAKVLTS